MFRTSLKSIITTAIVAVFAFILATPVSATDSGSVLGASTGNVANNGGISPAVIGLCVVSLLILLASIAIFLVGKRRNAEEAK